MLPLGLKKWSEESIQSYQRPLSFLGGVKCALVTWLWSLQQHCLLSHILQDPPAAGFTLPGAPSHLQLPPEGPTMDLGWNRWILLRKEGVTYLGQQCIGLGVHPECTRLCIPQWGRCAPAARLAPGMVRLSPPACAFAFNCLDVRVIMQLKQKGGLFAKAQ